MAACGGTVTRTCGWCAAVPQAASDSGVQAAGVRMQADFGRRRTGRLRPGRGLAAIMTQL
jgi:hypothetical protein